MENWTCSALPRLRLRTLNILLWLELPSHHQDLSPLSILSIASINIFISICSNPHYSISSVHQPLSSRKIGFAMLSWGYLCIYLTFAVARACPGYRQPIRTTIPIRKHREGHDWVLSGDRMEFTRYDPVLSLGPAPTSLLVARIPSCGYQSRQKLLTVLVECSAITPSRVSSQLLQTAALT